MVRKVKGSRKNVAVDLDASSRDERAPASVNEKVKLQPDSSEPDIGQVANDEMFFGFPRPPFGIEPPIDLAEEMSEFQLWCGDAEAQVGTHRITGTLKVVLHFQPRLVVRWSLTFEEDLFKSIGRNFGEPQAEVSFVTSGPIREVVGLATSSSTGFISGFFESQIPKSLVHHATRAVYLIINGPLEADESIARGNTMFMGRMTAERGSAEVFVDRLNSDDKRANRATYTMTHVAEFRFNKKPNSKLLEGMGHDLFRSLSLMRNGWAGVAGPWLFQDEKLLAIVPQVTKCTRFQTTGWYGGFDRGVFKQLFALLEEQATSGDDDRISVWQTAFHWLIESELCAGGLEGAMILQQAALEAVAWYEIVTKRRLCSEAGFEKLPAEDKLRWLCSLFRIPATIPDQAKELKVVAKTLNQIDVIGALSAVRNALVHNTPKKMRRLRSIEGEGGFIELWRQVGGVLELVVLAMLGFQGTSQRRDTEGAHFNETRKPVPWLNLKDN